jgi:DNA invertase Pin-like site-specific DNA recombinase/transposase
VSHPKVAAAHLERRAAIYVRQSTPGQVATNAESRRRQYALVERAAELGWARQQVMVIDDDLGVSGTGTTRAGFERLVAEVGLGRIGIVLGLEASRLARNNRDWYRLLDLCGVVDTLIADADGIYHPGQFNDRLLLGLKGTMSEAELHLIRSRLAGGLWEKARRGELAVHLPVGYDHDASGRIVVTPDEAVQATIRLVFAKFAELGSARQVAAHLRDAGVPLPHRRCGQAEVSWQPATFAPIHRILTNPTYAGIYAYGRSKVERRVDHGGRVTARQRPRALGEWEVCIPDHHEGFITPAAWRANLQRLRANWRAPAGEGGGAVREGPALLQGLLRCGRCGRKLQVAYAGTGGTVRRYACHQGHRLQGAEHSCQSLGGKRVDDTVVAAFLEALAPAGLEATLAALSECEAAWAAELAQRELLVEQARYQAERGRRQFDRVEPENRLVARSLERAWEQRLGELARRQDELARFTASRPTPLSTQERRWLQTAGADLAAVWNAPTTSDRDRKQLLRCLISEVVVTVDRARAVADLTVVWVGGATSALCSKLNHSGGHRHATTAEVLELIRRLAVHYDDEQIAFTLNAKRLRTGKDNSFTARRVHHLRARHHIPGPDPAVTPNHDDPAGMNVTAAATALGVSQDTVRRWAREGFVEAAQVTPHAPWRIRVTDELRGRVVANAPAGWVGLAEAAARLGRSRQTILHWVQSGKLQAVQVTSGKRKGLRIEVTSADAGLFAGP